MTLRDCAIDEVGVFPFPHREAEEPSFETGLLVQRLDPFRQRVGLEDLFRRGLVQSDIRFQRSNGHFDWIGSSNFQVGAAGVGKNGCLQKAVSSPFAVVQRMKNDGWTEGCEEAFVGCVFWNKN